jgi:hypothetical protein
MTMYIDDLMNLVSKNQFVNMHQEGFKETCGVILDFIDNCKGNISKIHWVCNSAPGHGKTTALTKIVQQMATVKSSTPLLLVFNNGDNLSCFYDEVVRYSKEAGKTKFIQYVESDNLETVLESINEYPVLCIMQQRLRNMAIGIGNKDNYLWYKTLKGKSIPRQIIVDESPIFWSDCTFDISSKDNSVDWFDSIGIANKLTPEELQFGRTQIMNLVSHELLTNIHCSTLRLIRFIEGSLSENMLMTILNKLKIDGIDNDTFNKFSWFKKLLLKDNVGEIDRQHNGNQIICSERIDYRGFGNILILDGTSSITKSIYNNEYEYKEVQNYHGYANRLQIHFRDINTSTSSRKNPSISGAIADDVEQIRKSGIFPFPLMAKDDVNRYILNGVIDENQKVLFQQSQDENGDMPLNLLNTVGKNILSKYNSLALLNLPIRNPVYYKKIAISLYGTDVDVSMAKGNVKQWFNEPKVQKVFEEVVMADLLQIIHRSSLRHISDTPPVHIFLYTNRVEWLEKLKTTLNLTDRNLTKLKLNDDYLDGFIEECKKWAYESKNYCLKHHTEELFTTPSYKASEIGGKKFKDWFNKNWKNEQRKEGLLRIFAVEGMEFVIDKNNYKTIRLYEDTNVFG